LLTEKGALDRARWSPSCSRSRHSQCSPAYHRDIKPDNIFLCDGEEDTFVKLLDFGIAKSSSIDGSDDSLTGETKTGQVVGTPFYMSPEQVTASKVIDHRSDLWALGVVAYEALTGQRPYDGPSFGALMIKIATGTPPKPTSLNPALPPSVDVWFAKACARRPDDRFKARASSPTGCARRSTAS
jgi:serine/threonine-protein kinase